MGSNLFSTPAKLVEIPKDDGKLRALPELHLSSEVGQGQEGQSVCRLSARSERQGGKEDSRIHQELETDKKKTTSTLKDLAELINPIVRGWVNYYGRFYRSKMMHLLEYLNLTLAR